MAKYTRLKDIHVRLDEVEEARGKAACKRRGAKPSTKMRELYVEWVESVLGPEKDGK